MIITEKIYLNYYLQFVMLYNVVYKFFLVAVIWMSGYYKIQMIQTSWRQDEIMETEWVKINSRLKSCVFPTCILLITYSIEIFLAPVDIIALPFCTKEINLFNESHSWQIKTASIFNIFYWSSMLNVCFHIVFLW